MIGLTQKMALARMKYRSYNSFRPGGANKGLFQRIKYHGAANRIGSWFKRRYTPRRAVALNNARKKKELAVYKYSQKDKKAVLDHYVGYSRRGKTAPYSVQYKRYGDYLIR